VKRYQFIFLDGGFIGVNSDSRNPSLGEAARWFLASLPADVGEASQQEVYRFVRWYGWERPFAEITAPEVASYAEQLSLSDTDYIRKLELLRAFLVYAKKEGWTKTNLSTHLKTRKGKTRLPSSARQIVSNTVPLTRQGYAELEAEMAALKIKRSQAIDEMHRAAADKDFRENAPLEAAREQRGQLEGRIKKLEEALKLAIVIDEKQNVIPKVSIGDSIVLHDMASGERLCYMVVSPAEVDPVRGRISSASPLGKAIVGRGQGEIIEVAVPAGKLRYQIKEIEC